MLNRIVITGIGLAAPNGETSREFRHALLKGISGISLKEFPHINKSSPTGSCSFDKQKYQSRKECRRATRAGSLAIYGAHEALKDAGILLDEERERAPYPKERVGVYLGITENGVMETEREVSHFIKNDCDDSYWSPYYNPHIVANSPAGEVNLNLGITGPHCTIGGACAAGNMGIIHGVHMLQLGVVDIALAGGVSDSINGYSIIAGFKAHKALAEWQEGDGDIRYTSRPLDKNRKGVVVSEGVCLYTLERLEQARERGATIYGEIIGHHINTDATDFVLPHKDRQMQCMRKAFEMAQIAPQDVDLVNLHATGTLLGDIIECQSVCETFKNCPQTYVNSTKGLIGHTMGAAGALELAGNLMGFQDGLIHPCYNITELDPQCELDNLVLDKPKKRPVNILLNNSFGMLGINSVLIVRKYNP